MKITLSELRSLVDAQVKRSLQEAGWKPGDPIPPVQRPKGNYDPDKDPEIRDMVDQHLGYNDSDDQEEYSSVFHPKFKNNSDILHFIGKTLPFYGVLGTQRDFNGESKYTKFVLGTAVFEIGVKDEYEGYWVNDIHVVKNLQLDRKPLALVRVMTHEKEDMMEDYEKIKESGIKLVDSKTKHVWLTVGSRIHIVEDEAKAEVLFDFTPA